MAKQTKNEEEKIGCKKRVLKLNLLIEFEKKNILFNDLSDWRLSIQDLDNYEIKVESDGYHLFDNFANRNGVTCYENLEELMADVIILLRENLSESSTELFPPLDIEINSSNSLL